MANEIDRSSNRYFCWRDAIRKPIWILDRHWYGMLGWLYLNDLYHKGPFHESISIEIDVYKSRRLWAGV